MSYDVSLVTKTVDGVEMEVFDANMTSNCAPAWDAAGCRLRDFDGALAGNLAPHAEAAAAALEDDPSAYRSLIRGDGTWGTVDTAASFLSSIAAACYLHPSARVRVHR